MNGEHGPTIGLIHATPLSVGPIARAMEEEFPTAHLRNVLDDSLLADLQAAGGLTEPLANRIRRLVAHLLADDVDAVQLACSGFAPVVDELSATVPTPIRKPDEAMYRGLADSAYRCVGILATVRATLDFATVQLHAEAGAHDRVVEIRGRCRPEAMAAAQAGDDAALAAHLVEAAREVVAEGAEVIALAQYSLSPLAERVAAATGLEVHTGPHAAARELRALLGA